MRKKKNKPETPDATPPVETIGRKFAHAREALGLTVEDVAHILRMRVSLLRDIENDDLQNFSHPTYARLTLLDYARFLRIPESEVRPWLPDPGSPMSTNYQYLERISDPEPAARRADVLDQTRQTNPFARLLRLALILIALAIVANGVLLAINLLRITHSSGKGNATASDADSASVEPAALPSPEEERQWLDEKVEVFTAIASESTAPSETTDPIQLEGTASNESTTPATPAPSPNVPTIDPNTLHGPTIRRATLP